MRANDKNWNEEELKAYLLLFCANSNYKEVNQDLNILKYNISKEIFNEVSKEFDKDNDYQSIQKICMIIESKGYSKEQLDSLFQEVKGLFLSGGKLDIVRRSIFMGFKRILISAA